MEHPNIELIVKHDTSKEGKAFSDQAYKAMREQLSKLIGQAFIKRVKDVWCDNKEHHASLTKIIINADDYNYNITEVCCSDYNKKLNDSLVGIEKEV